MPCVTVSIFLGGWDDARLSNTYLVDIATMTERAVANLPRTLSSMAYTQYKDSVLISGGQLKTMYTNSTHAHRGG